MKRHGPYRSKRHAQRAPSGLCAVAQSMQDAKKWRGWRDRKLGQFGAASPVRHIVRDGKPVEQT
jgi:hypothetical protein